MWQPSGNFAAQTNERIAKVVVDNLNAFQSHLCGVHNDNDIYAPIQQTP